MRWPRAASTHNIGRPAARGNKHMTASAALDVVHLVVAPTDQTSKHHHFFVWLTSSQSGFPRHRPLLLTMKVLYPRWQPLLWSVIVVLPAGSGKTRARLLAVARSYQACGEAVRIIESSRGVAGYYELRRRSAEGR